MGNKASVWLLSIALVVFYLIVFMLAGYGGLVEFYVVLAVAGSAALVIARYAVKLEATVTLRGVDRAYALRVASHALYVAEDNLVGFPSGKFETARTEDPAVIVATEFKPRSSHRMVLRMLLVPWAIAGSIVMFITVATRNGWAFLIGQSLRIVAFMYFMFFFIVPLALALLVELILKRFVGSVITVRAVEEGSDVQLHFTFQGASALLAKARLLSSFEAPELPARFHTPAMALAAQVGHGHPIAAPVAS